MVCWINNQWSGEKHQPPSPLQFGDRSSPCLFSPDSAAAETLVNMRKVTHQTINEELSKTVLLPCVFTLHPSSSTEVPRVKWTKVWGQRGSDGLQKEQSVLVARDNVVKVTSACCCLEVCRSRSRAHFPPRSAGEEGFPGPRGVAWLQRKPLQRQSGVVRVALQ